MATEQTLLTADELLSLPDDGLRHELIRGELTTMPPAGGEHGLITNKLAFRLTATVESQGLGFVFAAETGVFVEQDPDTVRAPDIAFIARTRLPGGLAPRGFLRVVPDLVAEVVSPGDRASEVEEKVQTWLNAGVRMVWVVHPSRRSVTVYRSFAMARILTEADSLTGEDIVPGFSIPVRDIFVF
jgi:Uma2 family endonuclease